MVGVQTKVKPFIIKDCSLAAIATGERASRLDEFRDKIGRIHLGCIYHHFCGGRLHTRFAHPDYHNDFSAWAHYGLHDDFLAERLNIIDPTEYANLEDLRQEVIEIVEQRLDEVETVPISSKANQFFFIRSKTIVFETSQIIRKPQEFINKLSQMSNNSIFFHFIEARRREPQSIDDFSFWLQSFDGEYDNLIDQLKEIDPYFLTLGELKQEILNVFLNYFGHISR
jgi:hypothetical protein